MGLSTSGEGNVHVGNANVIGKNMFQDDGERGKIGKVFFMNCFPLRVYKGEQVARYL